MIPDEAIELALIANWDTEGDQKERMRAALEAAAPHIIANALRKAADELEYGNPIGSWLYERADELDTP